MRDVLIWLGVAAALAAALAGGAAIDARARGRDYAVEAASPGDPELGRRKLREYGCGSCHAIPGVPGAAGRVGPALGDLRSRLYLAGRIQNGTPQLEEWIRHPQAMQPGTVMPDTGVTAEDAGHMAAYLYSLR